MPEMYLVCYITFATHHILQSNTGEIWWNVLSNVCYWFASQLKQPNQVYICKVLCYQDLNFC